MVNTPAAWLRLVAGLGVVFALFQWIASALHSDRGQAGAAVAVLVVGATVAPDIALSEAAGFNSGIAITIVQRRF
jgi:predicted benzoate:H+ symporter BenE